MIENSDEKKRILIVEDSSIVQLDLGEKLKSLGFEIVSMVATGESAILKALELKPDIILMDIILDGEIDGIKAAGEIKNKLNIPVIYTTAHSDMDMVSKAKSTAPYGFLIKPYNSKDLYITIQIAIARHEFDMKLKESESKYRKLFESTSDPIFFTDNNYKLIDFNRALVELFGFNHEELKTKSLISLFKDESDIITITDVINNSGYIKDFEIKLLNKDNDELDCILSSHMRITDFGEGIGYFGLIKDITDAKQCENYKISKINKTMEGIVQAMSLTVEARDPYTAGHQKRVATLAYEIAREMGLREEVCNGIQMASFIHDLGKIHIPAEILAKPGKLSEDEFSIIKTHPQVGYDILKNIEFPRPIAKIVYQHHERLDGSGYPRGISGNEILLEAKIIGVADVIEAMAFHRPYRAALGIEKAMEEIKDKRGTFFDPEVVDACLKVINVDNFDFDYYNKKSELFESNKHNTAREKSYTI